MVENPWDGSSWYVSSYWKLTFFALLSLSYKKVPDHQMPYHVFNKCWFIRHNESSVYSKCDHCVTSSYCLILFFTCITERLRQCKKTIMTYYILNIFITSFSDEKKSCLNDTVKFGAFADTNKKNIEPEIIIPEVPFSKLIISERPHQDSSPSPTKEVDDCSKTILLEDQNGNSPTEKPKAALTLKPTNDDFIMVELVNFFADWRMFINRARGFAVDFSLIMSKRQILVVKSFSFTYSLTMVWFLWVFIYMLCFRFIRLLVYSTVLRDWIELVSAKFVDLAIFRYFPLTCN